MTRGEDRIAHWMRSCGAVLKEIPSIRPIQQRAFFFINDTRFCTTLHCDSFVQMGIHSKCEHNLQQSEAQTKQVNQPTKQETHIFFSNGREGEKIFTLFSLRACFTHIRVDFPFPDCLVHKIHPSFMSCVCAYTSRVHKLC